MARTIDQPARTGVAKAIAMIEAHERVCEERAKASYIWRTMLSENLDGQFTMLNDRLLDLSGQVTKIYGHMWIVAGSIISLLLASVAYLIVNRGL